jgi:hypothetical protein
VLEVAEFQPCLRGTILAMVRRLLTPTALCVLIVMATLPAAALLCEWECAPSAGASTPVIGGHHHHDAAHEHGEDLASQASNGSTVSSADCVHDAARLPALMSAKASLATPPVMALASPFLLRPETAALRRAAATTPGARSSPTQLRI